MFSNNKIGYSERKHLRQKIKMHNLLSKIYLAKKKDVFKPNLDKIKSNLVAIYSKIIINHTKKIIYIFSNHLLI